MEKYRWCVCLLVVWCLILCLCVQGIPFGLEERNDQLKIREKSEDILKKKSEAEDVDVSYQNDEEFKREIRDKLDEHNRNKGVLFDRILLVNDIHKRWKNVYEMKKRNVMPNVEDVIIENNLKHHDMYFEGDIKLDKNEIESLHGTIDDMQTRRKRNAVHKRKMIWTSREVPYLINSSLTTDAVKKIGEAIAIVHNKTCVRWIKYNPSYHKNYVLFTKGEGCYSAIGKVYYKRGQQELSIGQGCEWVPTVLHEMTHAMGFFHEQSRNDRDKYIEIKWENIPKDFKDQFEKYSHGTIDKMGIEYDYNSLMHYSSKAFGNGKVTIQPIDPTKTIGNSQTYTTLDALEINSLYDCKTSSSGQSFSSWSAWSECDKNCYKQRQRFCFHRDKTKCQNTNAYGIESEYIECTEIECSAPINGNWGHWAEWSGCSKSCDEGERQRSRRCNKPVPNVNGKICVGGSLEIAVCNNGKCNIVCEDKKVDCGNWAAAGECQKNHGFMKVECKESCGLCPTSKPTTPVECGDKKVDCGNWAAAGECQKNAGFMKVECKESCGLCPTSKPTTPVECGDKKVDCANWAAAGECQKNPGFMKVECKESCGLCPTSKPTMPVECGDKKADCANWAAAGECQKNPGFMKVECKESCGLCPTSKPTTPVECGDKKVDCGNWAAAGECQKNPGFMKVECKESCGLCPTSKPTKVP